MSVPLYLSSYGLTHNLLLAIREFTVHDDSSGMSRQCLMCFYDNIDIRRRTDDMHGQDN